MDTVKYMFIRSHKCINSIPITGI